MHKPKSTPRHMDGALTFEEIQYILRQKKLGLWSMGENNPDQRMSMRINKLTVGQFYHVIRRAVAEAIADTSNSPDRDSQPAISCGDGH